MLGSVDDERGTTGHPAPRRFRPPSRRLGDRPHVSAAVRGRGRGVERAADAADVEIVTITLPLMNTAPGESAAGDFLALRRRPTALFCAKGLLALGVLRVLLGGGLAVPTQVSHIGYDDIEFGVRRPFPSRRWPGPPTGMPNFP